MPPVRHPDLPGVIYEPVVVLLSALPAPSAEPALVTDSETGSGPGSAAGAEPARLTAWVRGRVQGVGFRWWVRSRALEFHLTGYAANLDDGRVLVVAEGSRDDCTQLLAALGGLGTPGRVTGVTERWDTPRGGLTGFAER